MAIQTILESCCVIYLICCIPFSTARCAELRDDKYFGHIMSGLNQPASEYVPIVRGLFGNLTEMLATRNIKVGSHAHP